MLIVAPEVVGFNVNFASPDAPVVDVGLPWHFWMEPEMPPQIWRSATFLLWVSMFLKGSYVIICGRNDENFP